jgi:hypothetical protein
MTTVEDQLWASFQSAVERLNQSVTPEERGFITRIDRHANDVFPFRAHVSYSPVSAPGHERLVLSVDFRRGGGVVEGRLDIARGDGVALVDESLCKPFDDLGGSAESVITAAATALEPRIVSQAELVDRELRPGQ